MPCSRIKGYYTASSISGSPPSAERWLDPTTGYLYMSADAPDNILGKAGAEVSPGVWQFRYYTWEAAATAREGAQAFKADDGKPNWSLLMAAQGCAKALAGVVRVLSFAVAPKDKGGKGYTKHSWREVPEAKERYEAALYRHLNKLNLGETHDDESKESHWYHVATNALFLAELHNAEENQ